MSDLRIKEEEFGFDTKASWREWKRLVLRLTWKMETA